MALERSGLKPAKKVLWAILAKDAEEFLPLYFECLLNQTYPKSEIFLYIRTNDNSDNTADILKEFIQEHGDKYSGIYFDENTVDLSLKDFDRHDWNSYRLRVIGQLRQDSINYARDLFFDYYFVSDVDNFILPDTLESLVSLELQAVAPLLNMVIPETTSNPYENRYYSTFYAADKNFFYRESPEVNEIVLRRKPGVHKIDLIHCTYLLHCSILPKADYCIRPGNWEFMNLMLSLESQGIERHIDARKQYGVLTLSEGIDDVRFQMKNLQSLNDRNSALNPTERAFTEIYAGGDWGYRSGSGSYPDSASEWISYVNDLIMESSASRVLEIGCGDFRVGAEYQLNGAQYLGIDVCRTIINDNQERHTKSNIQFQVQDFENPEFFGEWDLILIKDVLQHLPFISIKNIVNKICQSSRLVVFCNDHNANVFDISVGGHRGIDLNASPFNFGFREVLNYGDKRVLLYRDDSSNSPYKGLDDE